MLGLNNTTELSERLWHALPSRVELPETVRNSFHKQAKDGPWVGCNRQYSRRAFAKPVIVIDGDVRHACFSKDLSRKGVGVYAPLNFLPKAVIRLWLPSGELLAVRVTRCRRLGERCYEVGSSFCASE